MLKVEFHTHTIYSKDSLARPEVLVRRAQQRGIDRLIVTDHNTIEGARAAQALDPERVIVGEEIMTTRGELLAAFVAEEVPAGLSPVETIARLRAQGAFISVSHPFDRQRSGHWKLQDLFEIMGLVDAVEVFNARCMHPVYNFRAMEFARKHSLLGTVGSDAHADWEVGRATLLLPDFSDAEGLKAGLRGAVAKNRLSSPLVHITSRYAVWRKRAGLVWWRGYEHLNRR